MKKIFRLSIIVLLFAYCSLLINGHGSSNFIKAFNTKEYNIQENLAYFEMDCLSNSALQRVSAAEYAKRLNAYKTYLKEIDNSYETLCQEDNHTSSRAIIIPPALDVPNITLIGVTNGGTTTSNVTINVDYCTDIGVTNIGMQLSFEGSDYVAITSGYICNSPGHYSIRAWNPNGYTYKSFDIRGVTQVGTDTTYYDEKGYLIINTRLAFRNEDSNAIVTITSEWESLPAALYRPEHRMYMTLRQGQWSYDQQGRAKLTREVDWIEKTKKLNGDIISIDPYSQNTTEYLTDTGNLFIENVIDETDSSKGLVSLSTHAPIPLDYSQMISLTEKKDVSYLRVSYEFECFVKLKIPNFTIGNFTAFPLSSNGYHYIDISAGSLLQWGNTILNVAELIVQLVGLIPGTETISIIISGGEIVYSLIPSNKIGEVLNNWAIDIQCSNVFEIY